MSLSRVLPAELDVSGDRPPQTISPRVLCVCHGGSVRSAAVAFHLKVYHQVDALTVGIVYNEAPTVAMLCEWAQVIWLAEPEMLDAIPEPHRAKVVEDFTGPDIWGYSCAADLMELAGSIAGRLSPA